jgi:hypothetical protein
VARAGRDVDRVHLRPAASDAEIDRIQLEAVTVLGKRVPDDYVEFLGASDGAQIENVLLFGTADLVGLNLDRRAPGELWIGGNGNMEEYVFDVAAQSYHSVRLGVGERLSSFQSLEELLLRVLSDQGVQ